MAGGKIFIFLLILVIATFALRYVGNVTPGVQPSPQGSSSQTSTVAAGSGGDVSQSGKPAGSSNNSNAEYEPPIPEQVLPQQPQELALTIATSEIPQGFTRNQLSRYFHKVRLASVYFPGDIVLSPAFGEEETPINVTGWLIQARRGGQTIPQAINIYEPTGLGAETDIYLKSNDTLQMFSSASAIGKNFRLNKCIGALEIENHFTPSLPGYCPAIYRDYSEISGFTGKCQDYISSLNYCTTPDFYSAEIAHDDYACQAYLQNNINFKGCFDKYRGDSDFLANEIWAWTGNDRLLDDRHDRVLLFDRAGLLVDEYNY